MCEENVVQLWPNFLVTIALALWPWGEADSQGLAPWVMLFTHVWEVTCGNTHGQLTWEVLASPIASWLQLYYEQLVVFLVCVCVCDGDEVILQGHCCGRYGMWCGTLLCMWAELHSPTVLCHRLTANRRLQVTVTTAGIVRWGRVLAATWVTGELEGNFNTIMTSCCIWSLNIRGLCGRKHYWVEERKDKVWKRME